MASINDEYEKLMLIGQGSYASIWKVRHRKYGYIRTLKILNTPVQDENDRAYQQFVKECTVLLNIGNGANYNIVHIYQPRLIDNRAVVEMDFIDGETLDQYLRRNKFMPIDEVLRFIGDIGGALAYCHHDIYKYMMNPNEDDLKSDPDDGRRYIIDEATEQRLVRKYAVTHNDLHSNNVMRRENDGSYVLLDFGLAIQNGTAVKSSALRGGALEYMAPEKFDDNNVITTQSDIYSFGILMYEALAGRVPFVLGQGASFSDQTLLYQQHKTGIPPEIEPLRREAFESANPGQEYVKDFPDWLEQMIMRCLEKDPARRYTDAKVLYEEIKKITIVNNGFELKEKLKEAKRTIARLNETIKVQTEKNEKLQDVNDTLADTISSQKKSISKLKKEKKALFDENVEIASQLDLKAKSYTDDTEEIDRLKGINDDINQQLSFLSWENERLKAKIKERNIANKENKNKRIWLILITFIVFVLFVVVLSINIGKKDIKISELYVDNLEKEGTLNSLEKKIKTYEKLCLPSGYCIDLGLPSGTLWNITNEVNKDDVSGYYTYDEAVREFGDRLPTKEQIIELRDNCTWMWDTARKGYEVIGKNGKSIFMPAFGDRNCDNAVYNVDSAGYYWSSSTNANTNNVFYLYYNSNQVGIGENDRCFGHSVRLVKSPTTNH